MTGKKERTRELIVDISYTLFAKYGFNKITMKDICDATNMSRGGLYSHFSGTREIFEAILEKLNQKDVMNFSEEIEKGIPAIEIMNRALLLMENEMNHSEDSLSLAMYEYSGSVDSNLMEHFNNIGEKKWTALIEYGIERGEFYNVNVAELVNVILYAYQGVRMWSRIIPIEPEVFKSITNHIKNQVHKSIEDSCEIIKNVLSAPETYAVCLKEDNMAIGSIGLIPSMQSHTTATHEEIEIGYWIGVPFWGCGYIPEAVREMQRHAFEELGCKAMWCGYYDGNEKSKRCQEKCGFTYHHTEENKPCTLMGDVRTEHFTYLTRGKWKISGTANKKTIVLYIHGQGGHAKEAEHYKSLFPECDVYGLDYHTFTPWETSVEIKEEIAALKKKYESIILIANSIGAYFSINAGIDVDISRAYFISPIVDMEKLIRDMISWANVTEEELQKKKTIETTFGETLSWEYLSYVRNKLTRWSVKTDILYGNADHLTTIETMTEFAKRHKADLTVMDGGEHWFHTSQQMEFLDQWIRKAHGAP